MICCQALPSAISRQVTGHPAVVVGAKEHLGQSQTLYISVTWNFSAPGHPKRKKNNIKTSGPKPNTSWLLLGNRLTTTRLSTTPWYVKTITNSKLADVISGAILWEMDSLLSLHVHGEGCSSLRILSLEHWCNFWEMLWNDPDQYPRITNHLKNGSSNQQK